MEVEEESGAEEEDVEEEGEEGEGEGEEEGPGMSVQHPSSALEPSLTPTTLAQRLLAALPDLASQRTILFFTTKEANALCTEYIALRGLGDPEVRRNSRLDVALAQGITAQPRAAGAGAAVVPLTFPSPDSSPPPPGQIPSLPQLRASLHAPAATLQHSPSLPREDILSQWHTRFTPWWALTFHSHASAAGEVLARAGSPPQVHVGKKVLQGGRRSVTWVAGLEAFRIDAKTLACELARLLAAAATLQPAAPLGVAMEGIGGGSLAVVVQGEEVARVVDFLVHVVGLAAHLVHVAKG